MLKNKIKQALMSPCLLIIAPTLYVINLLFFGVIHKQWEKYLKEWEIEHDD